MNLLKLLKYINPKKLFKSLKHLMENRAKLEADAIEHDKQRKHDDAQKDKQIQHEKDENYLDRNKDIAIEIVKSFKPKNLKELSRVLEITSSFSRRNFILKYGKDPEKELIEIKNSNENITNIIIDDKNELKQIGDTNE